MDLGCDVWNQHHIQTGHGRLSFPVMLDLTPYSLHLGIRPRHQLAAIITSLGLSQEDAGNRITFLRIFGQWIRFNNTGVEAVSELAA
jgi:hypothetical protein